MNKNLQNIDKAFFERLQHYIEDAPNESWDFIKNELNKKDAALYKSKYLFLKTMIICAMLTGVLTLLSNTLQPVLPEHKYSGMINEHQNSSPQAKQQLSNINSDTKKNNLKHVTSSKKISNLSSVKYSDDKKYFSALQKSIGQNKILGKVESADNSLVNSSNNFLIPGIKNSTEINVNFKKDKTKQIETSSIKIKKRPAFYLLPYFSIDHVSSRIKQVYNAGTIALPGYKQEKPDVAYTAGLLIEHETSNNFSLKTGILYSRWQASVLPSVVTALQQSAGNSQFRLSTDYGYAELKKASNVNTQNGDSLKITSGAVNLKAVSIPLIVQLNLKQGKLKANIQAGSSISIITSDAAELEYISKDKKETETVQKLQGLRHTYFSAITGIEATYSISKKTSIGLNPVLRYAITPANKNTPVKNYPLSVGAGISLHIKL